MQILPEYLKMLRTEIDALYIINTQKKTIENNFYFENEIFNGIYSITFISRSFDVYILR